MQAFKRGLFSFEGTHRECYAKELLVPGNLLTYVLIRLPGFKIC
ncbi:MAG: hypothetical protein JWP81_3825 [Ferruginibacter sp.]|nr:hypothetical protein [Ferruginibacter sp.]